LRPATTIHSKPKYKKENT
jgi:hypothetical protein